MLGLAKASVYDRLLRLGIQTQRGLKLRANNQRSDVRVPERSERLAELFGILLGDGHISHFQVMVTLGTKEFAYAQYVQALLRDIFGGIPKISTSSRGYQTVYLGSTATVRWLKENGFVHNKVAAQVDVPKWVFEKREYMSSFIRGFFDTDGSVYRLRFGAQISITNNSEPLLISLQTMLRALGYAASESSAHRIYLTKRDVVQRFFKEIRPANQKHQRRFRDIADAPVV
ncbi:MAG: hypothetical protein RLZZ416_576 [Candidatus Parcubacteria bacterium]